MKNLFNFLLAIYNELLYNGICRRFPKMTELLPELKGGIKILEIGFGKGTGNVFVISPYKVNTPLLFYENKPMYFAEVQLLENDIKGYLYAVKNSDYFIKLFQTEKKDLTDFSFDSEGIITKSGIKMIFAAIP